MERCSKMDVAAEPERVDDISLLDRALTCFGQIGHGRLWCTCGYLIWGCKAHKECDGPQAMIETDHALCKKKQ